MSHLNSANKSMLLYCVWLTDEVKIFKLVMIRVIIPNGTVQNSESSFSESSYLRSIYSETWIIPSIDLQLNT